MPKPRAEQASLGPQQGNLVPWVGEELLSEGLTPAAVPSESLPNVHCRRGSAAKGLSQSRCEAPAARTGSDHILSSTG